MISIRLADLAEVRAAGIVRPVSAEWQAVTPAMRRLEMAAGAALGEHCSRLGELPVGSAAITTAGNLPVQFMVHAVVRSNQEQVSAASVQRALQNALRRAAEWGLDTIAIAPFGTGAGNLDAEESARIMLEVLHEHMLDSRYPESAEIIVDSEYEREVFERQLAGQSLPHLYDPRAEEQQ
ncbi:MAG: macro domain-containing protein [Longimicrobiales bacterium]